MNFDEWVDAARVALELEDDVDVEVLLDLARQAAHATERRAAPVTTYLMGVAVGRGMSFEDAADRVAALTPAG